MTPEASFTMVIIIVQVTAVHFNIFFIAIVRIEKIFKMLSDFQPEVSESPHREFFFSSRICFFVSNFSFWNKKRQKIIFNKFLFKPSQRHGMAAHAGPGLSNFFSLVKSNKNSSLLDWFYNFVYYFHRNLWQLIFFAILIFSLTSYASFKWGVLGGGACLVLFYSLSNDYHPFIICLTRKIE